jgi:hypothetical protein
VDSPGKESAAIHFLPLFVGFKGIVLEQARKISLRVHVLQKCKEDQRIGNLDAEPSRPDAPDVQHHKTNLYEFIGRETER